ncbi:hypothetical protein [Ancylobacter sp.]|uniref:hypothetical protein n=1 Tax=Ancylobacter sp. TaxID=1872567 RepID=UPI003C7A72C1
MAQPLFRLDRLIAGLPARSSVTRGGGMALRLLCALALMLALALHRPPVASPAGPGIDLAQYTLPDGTVPDLCLTGTGEDGTPLAALHRPSCEACRLHAIAALPGPAEDQFVRAFYRRLVQAIAPDPRRGTPAPLFRLSSRGPPAPGHAALFAAGGRLPVL